MTMDSSTDEILEHEWTVLCRSSAVDKDSGALSVFNIVNRMTVNRARVDEHMKQTGKDEFVVPTDFELITLWSKRSEQSVSVEAKTEILDPSGRSMMRFSYNVYLKEGNQRRRNRAKIHGFKITGEGRYRIAISVRKDEGEQYRPVTETSLDVIFGATAVTGPRNQ